MELINHSPQYVGDKTLFDREHIAEFEIGRHK